MADEKEDVISIGRFSEFKNQSIDWLIEHKKSILYTITFAMMFLFLAYHFFSKFHKKSESDYIQADVSFHRWIASNDSNAEFFDVLKKSIVKHPELHAKYDGLIAEKLLSRKDFEEVKPFATSAMDHLKPYCPFHARFASNSLQIAEGNFAAALEEAKLLKVSMENESSLWEGREKLTRFGPILYAYNLVRIAFLEKETGSPKGELAAWEELEKKAGWSGNESDPRYYDTEAYQQLLQNFRSQSISLVDYIQHRKNELYRM